ncbi:MAG TPA: multicopper oxidase domain-containing protein [Streptosporangiaceae bacterium]|nr:multicopper oxidase domain-containing protein [Streptosporangiaceae bacterium]
MSLSGKPAPPYSGRGWKIALLTLLLSTGVVGFQLGIDALFGRPGGGLANAPREMLFSVPAAVVAAWLGLKHSPGLNPGRTPGFTSALNRAALASLAFMALFVPMAVIGGFFTGSAVAISGRAVPHPALMVQALRGISDALIGEVAALPLLLVTLLLIAHARATTRPPGLRRAFQLASVAASVAMVGYFVTPGASAAAASSTASPVSGVAAGTASNPCTTAPIDTFNISAINVDMPLNRYGTHDPNGFMYVLNSQIPAVRTEEASQQVSSGLQGGDAIQPLVIRGHEGDCVTINLTNATTFGVQAADNAAGQMTQTPPQNVAWNVDGLPAVTSAGNVSSDVGNNPDNTAAPGQTVSYTVYLDPALGEGAHVFHSTGDYRQTQGHGLFGALISEPQGSQFLDPHTLQPEQSGWDAVIKMPSGSTEGIDNAPEPSFREFALLFHEIGDEDYRQILEPSSATCQTAIPGAVGAQEEVSTAAGCEVPFVDPFSGAYRPCSKAINYRSECFFERELIQQEHGFNPDEAQDYSSYTNGEMATPRPEMYVGDPYKIRLINAGTEMGHVFHEHGGAIRWLRNPGADNPDLAGGLEKNPPLTKNSIRLDSQTIEPGETYTLETECGGGGCQQSAGDFLFHCHIAAHYDAGMLGFLRVFNTQQADLATLPGRAVAPTAVNSAGLLGKTVEGKTVVLQSQLTDPSTQVALESLVENQLPPQGVPVDQEDATVWNWAKGGTASAPVYLGEPEDTISWPNYTAPNPGQRDPILFDPDNGRLAYPLLEPHLGQRPPFSPDGHSGAPYLGPTVTPTRADGLCPANAPVDHFNLTAITVPIQETNGGVDASGNPTPPAVDSNGEIFVLNEDKAATLNGTKTPNPLAVRANAGDCIAVTLTNEMTHTQDPQAPDVNVFDEANIHIHFVQFDVQGSDGVITGLNFETAVRPDFGTPGETTLTAAAPAGATQIQVASTSGLVPGASIEIGQGDPDTEIATKVTAINGNTLTLDNPLQNAHASGERTGVEFVQYRWYADAENGTVFFHDHVDALHSWGHGLFGALIEEPPGSTYHDPVTGATIRSGPLADIYTKGSAGFGEQGDFREFVLWQHEGIRSSGSSQGCELASFNLRAAPLIDRDPVNTGSATPPAGAEVPDGIGSYTLGGEAGYPACTKIGTSNDPYVFSSVAHGDPATPLLKAYVGDPVVIRQVGLDERVGDLRITGHRFAEETFNSNGVLTDAGTAGISEKMDYVLQGGAGKFPGDYLYYSGRSLELEGGAWGIFRVMDKLHTTGVNALEPLPDRTSPPSGSGFPTLTNTGKAPPAAPADSGSVCPGSAPVRTYNVSIFNGITLDNGQPGQSNAAAGGSWGIMYALTSDEAAIKAGTKPAVPLVIRANAGDCLKVTLKNDLPTDNFTWTWGSGSTRAGFNIGNVLYNPQTSYGGAIGFDPDSSVAPGGSRTYVYYVDKELGTNLILNLANESSWRSGAYGALIAEPKGSVYDDPFTGRPISSGLFADIFPGRGGPAPFREYTSIFSDREPDMGHNVMPYPTDFPFTYLDYNQQSLAQTEGNPTTNPPLWTQKSDSVMGGDPSTPLFEAYAGDPVRWRVADAAGDDFISFQVAGHSFPLDHGLAGSQIIEARALGGGETFDAYLVNGAGGATGATGDYEYNLGRGPLIKSGGWGIMRVLPAGGTTAFASKGGALLQLTPTTTG